MFVIPTLGKPRHEDCGFEASLGFIITPYCKNNNKNYFLDNFHQSGVEYITILSTQNFKRLKIRYHLTVSYLKEYQTKINPEHLSEVCLLSPLFPCLADREPLRVLLQTALNSMILCFLQPRKAFDSGTSVFRLGQSKLLLLTINSELNDLGV